MNSCISCDTVISTLRSPKKHYVQMPSSLFDPSPTKPSMSTHLALEIPDDWYLAGEWTPPIIKWIMPGFMHICQGLTEVYFVLLKLLRPHRQYSLQIFSHHHLTCTNSHIALSISNTKSFIAFRTAPCQSTRSESTSEIKMAGVYHHAFKAKIVQCVVKGFIPSCWRAIWDGRVKWCLSKKAKINSTRD